MLDSARGALAGVAVTAIAAAFAVLGAGGASASDDRVIRAGACQGPAHWILEVRSDDDGLEVEGEVHSNRGGQTWDWRLLHNGSLSAWGTRRTGSDGSFEVQRTMVDLRGTDTVVFRARQRGIGNVCRGTVNI